VTGFNLNDSPVSVKPEFDLHCLRFDQTATPYPHSLRGHNGSHQRGRAEHSNKPYEIRFAASAACVC
jgi:hypothetical protein